MFWPGGWVRSRLYLICSWLWHAYPTWFGESSWPNRYISSDLPYAVSLVSVWVSGLSLLPAPRELYPLDFVVLCMIVWSSQSHFSLSVSLFYSLPACLSIVGPFLTTHGTWHNPTQVGWMLQIVLRKFRVPNICKDKVGYLSSCCSHWVTKVFLVAFHLKRCLFGSWELHTSTTSILEGYVQDVPTLNHYPLLRHLLCLQLGCLLLVGWAKMRWSLPSQLLAA